MPLYEYQCESCEHRFEVIQKFSDAPVDTCPKCAGIVRRLLSSPAIQFKGSGWYITDYARKPGASAKSGDNAVSTGTNDSSPKTETAKTESSSSATSSTSTPKNE